MYNVHVHVVVGLGNFIVKTFCGGGGGIHL